MRIETEPDRLRAEAELVAAKKSTGGSSPRGPKRPRRNPANDDDSLAQLAGQPWHNMRSLSHAAWVKRPADSTDDLRVVFAAVLADAKNSKALQGYRPRMLPGTTDVIVVYVGIVFDVDPWVVSFWQTHTQKDAQENNAAKPLIRYGSYV